MNLNKSDRQEDYLVRLGRGRRGIGYSSMKRGLTSLKVKGVEKCNALSKKDGKGGILSHQGKEKIAGRTRKSPRAGGVSCG